MSKRPPNYSKRAPDKEVRNIDDRLEYRTAAGFTVDDIKRLEDSPNLFYAKRCYTTQRVQ